MAATRDSFQVPKKYNTLSIVLMAIGVISIIALYIATHGSGGTPEEKRQADARFWASLLQNSVYFLLVCNAVIFFIAAGQDQCKRKKCPYLFHIKYIELMFFFLLPASSLLLYFVAFLIPYASSGRTLVQQINMELYTRFLFFY